MGTGWESWDSAWRSRCRFGGGLDRRVKCLALWAAVAVFDLLKGRGTLAPSQEQGYADIGGNVLNYSFYEDARKQDPLKLAAGFKGPA